MLGESFYFFTSQLTPHTKGVKKGVHRVLFFIFLISQEKQEEFTKYSVLWPNNSEVLYEVGFHLLYF